MDRIPNHRASTTPSRLPYAHRPSFGSLPSHRLDGHKPWLHNTLQPYLVRIRLCELLCDVFLRRLDRIYRRIELGCVPHVDQSCRSGTRGFKCCFCGEDVFHGVPCCLFVLCGKRVHCSVCLRSRWSVLPRKDELVRGPSSHFEMIYSNTKRSLPYI